jgi:hypothetical protein
MRLLSWQVLSLPRFECYPQKRFDGLLPFFHLGTRVQPEALGDGRRVGDTVWGAMVDGRLAAASWDWIEILPNVVCLVDPSTVLTNIQFLDDRGCYEEPLQAMRSLNDLIYCTPWQEAVCSALDQSLPEMPSALKIGHHARELDQGLRQAA